MKKSSTEMDDESFFKQKSDIKIILLGDSAVGKSKYKYQFKYCT